MQRMTLQKKSLETFKYTQMMKSIRTLTKQLKQQRPSHIFKGITRPQHISYIYIYILNIH